MSVDRLVYVCDRVTTASRSSRPEVSSSRRRSIATNTENAGSVWDIAFSRDAEQRYIYIADGTNEKVTIIDRARLEGSDPFGDGGRQPGQFYGVHSIATDSQGNIYTTETYEGKRLQKFIPRGNTAVTVMNQGASATWPQAK